VDTIPSTRIVAASLTLVATVAALPAQPDTTVVAEAVWTRAAGGNGHRYLAVRLDGPLAWTGADVLAAARYSGHLATLTSADENDFVFTLIADPANGLWNTFEFGTIDEPIPVTFGPWLGGVQEILQPPDEGWMWVTGEPWDFTNWSPFEPNDLRGEERYLHFIGQDTPTPDWSDRLNVPTHPLAGLIVTGMIVEVPDGCSGADLATPVGEITFADISAFIAAFLTLDPVADLTAPVGQFTFADVTVFLDAFTAGCPE
jgi:hypothetical protein